MPRPTPSFAALPPEQQPSPGASGGDAAAVAGRRRVFIEAVQPQVDAGTYAVKRVIGDTVTVSADLIADGHDVVVGELVVTRPRLSDRHAADFAVRLEPLSNDRYAARFEVDCIGEWHYCIEAWVDVFASFWRGLSRKLEAAQDVAVDLLIGAGLVQAAAARAREPDRARLLEAALELADAALLPRERVQRARARDLTGLMARHPDRAQATRYARWLPLWVDRRRARSGAWYEMFPRSTGKAGEHGTFETCKARLPYVAEMGFDVLYLPPIHPIGHTHRKGKNNAVTAAADDVGSPWAIGSHEGGHKSVHPALGTLEQFDQLLREAARLGLELALDIALQVTPDHPYVKEHPEWFRHRPDGSIQYAENPPKKYQDIYPFDFECEAWWSLWLELLSIFEFWIERGVRIFRVDNPHTKSIAFWQWCIGELRRRHPDLIFLAEAFTRPKLMQLLAKVGFTQSYTYFTWRNTAAELREYTSELESLPVRDYFRPNFWVNTPDILPEHLQHAGPAAFRLRLVLAALLSSNYGVYGPAFELLDNVPRPGAEEYLDNEKYELKSWSVDRSDSLRPLIRRLNSIRRENSALQQNAVSFLQADNELLFCFSKHSADGDNSVLVVVNMDVNYPQSGWVELGEALALPGRQADPAPLQLHDLLSDARYFSEGRRLFVRLDPASAPAHIFKLRRRVRTEHDFDYYV